MNTKQFGLIAVILISFISQVSQADVPFTACSAVFSVDKLKSLENKLTPEEMNHLLRIGEEISMVPEILEGLQYNDNFNVSILDGESSVNIRFIDKPSESLSIYRTNPSNPPVLVVGLPSQQAPQPTDVTSKVERSSVVQEPAESIVQKTSPSSTSKSPSTIDPEISTNSNPQNIRRSFPKKQYSYEEFVTVVENISRATMRWRNLHYIRKIHTPDKERKALTKLFFQSRKLVDEYRTSQTLSRDTILRYGVIAMKLVRLYPHIFSKELIKKELNTTLTQFSYTFSKEENVFTLGENMISGASYRSNLLLKEILNELFPKLRSKIKERSRLQIDLPKQEDVVVERKEHKFTNIDLASILKSLPSVFTDIQSLATKIESNPGSEISIEEILQVKSAISKHYAYPKQTEILLFGGSKLLKGSFSEKAYEVLFSLAELNNVHGSALNMFLENLKFLAKHPELLLDTNGKPYENFNKIFEKFVTHYGLEQEYYEFIKNSFDSDISIQQQLFECLIWLNTAVHNKFNEAVSKNPSYNGNLNRSHIVEKLKKMPEFSEMTNEELLSKIYSRLYGSKLLTKNIAEVVQRSQTGASSNDKENFWIIYLQPYLIDAYLRSAQ